MLTSKGHFSVNGVQYKAKSIKVDLESLSSDDSGRTDDGVLHIYWIYRRIRKVSITMPPMQSSELAPLLLAVQGQEYNLTYWDPLTNSEKTIQAYTASSSADLYSGIMYNGLWQDAGFNAIEIAGEK